MRRYVFLLTGAWLSIFAMNRELDDFGKESSKKKQYSIQRYLLQNYTIIEHANTEAVISASKQDLNAVIALALANNVNKEVSNYITCDCILNLCSYTTTHRKIIKRIKQLQKKVSGSSNTCQISPREIAYLASCSCYAFPTSDWYQRWSTKNGMALDTKIDDFITLVSGKNIYKLKGDLAKCLHGFKVLQELGRTYKGVESGDYARYRFGFSVEKNKIRYFPDVSLIPTFNEALKAAMEATHDPAVQKYALK